jgi:large subunit ribosomal protein L17
MRHRVAHRKLGRTSPHRLALLRNLATSLLDKERIRTTLAKAKELRPFAEKLITLARREDNRVHARRLAGRHVQSNEVLKKLFDTLGPRFAGRNGGYSRILRLGPRKGDGAEMAVVELVGSEFKPEKKDEKGKKAGAAAPDGGHKAEKKPEKKPGKKAAEKPKRARASKGAKEAAAD